jgi:PKD repeat protein
MKAGESAYTKTFGSGRNRWGDYSLSAVDPANDTDLWTIQEYAALPPQPSPVSYWGTWWGRVLPDAGAATALPVAGFSASSSATTAGQSVSFTDTSAGATRWFWNFGDGTTSNDRNPVHAFQYSGTFSVMLSAVNQTGVATATRTIAVNPPAKASPEPISKDRIPRQVTPRR